MLSAEYEVAVFGPVRSGQAWKEVGLCRNPPDLKICNCAAISRAVVDQKAWSHVTSAKC